MRIEKIEISSLIVLLVFSMCATHTVGTIAQRTACTDALVSGQIAEWVPWIPRSDQVELFYWGGDFTSYVDVSVELPSTGYAVSRWGTPKIVGNSITVDAESLRSTGISLPVVLYDSQTYSLGTLPPGDYSFSFSAWGSTVKVITFNVTSSARLHVFDVAWGSGMGSYYIGISCNHSITSFNFYKAARVLRFIITADDSGLCNITIPRNRADSPFNMTVDENPTVYSMTQDATHSILGFAYNAGNRTIKITGTERGYIIGDVNGDGKVNIVDISIVALNFGHIEEDYEP